MRLLGGRAHHPQSHSQKGAVSAKMTRSPTPTVRQKPPIGFPTWIESTSARAKPTRHVSQPRGSSQGTPRMESGLMTTACQRSTAPSCHTRTCWPGFSRPDGIGVGRCHPAPQAAHASTKELTAAHASRRRAVAESVRVIESRSCHLMPRFRCTLSTAEHCGGTAASAVGRVSPIVQSGSPNRLCAMFSFTMRLRVIGQPRGFPQPLAHRPPAPCRRSPGAWWRPRNRRRQGYLTRGRRWLHGTGVHPHR